MARFIGDQAYKKPEINIIMKHLNEYSNWKPVNEGITIVTIQIAAILGILGWRGIKALLKKIGEHYGSKMELKKEELLDIVDDFMSNIKKQNFSGIKLDDVEKELKEKVESGEYKTIGQIAKYFDKF